MNESNYHYIQSEPGLWTVGTGAPGKGGNWEPESDHGSSEEAAARVRFLNGGDLPDLDQTAKLEAFVQKFLDNFSSCDICNGKGFLPKGKIECHACHGTGKCIESIGVLYVELPAEAQDLLNKVEAS